MESGKRGDEAGLAPLTVRAPFPSEWRLVLATPAQARGLHGCEERQAFARLSMLQTDALCRLVLLGMLPALAEADLEAFGESLHDFNARVGEAFAAVQGGIYAGPRVAELVEFVRRTGIRCVGQSSWGPTVFAVVEDEERAHGLRRQAGKPIRPGTGGGLGFRGLQRGRRGWKGSKTGRPPLRRSPRARSFLAFVIQPRRVSS